MSQATTCASARLSCSCQCGVDGRSNWTGRRAARLVALGELAATPLARRPYDLRHAFISTALAAGVPAPDIARWVGQSIEVLMKYYAAMLYGSAKTSQEKYAAELKSWEPEPDKKPAEEASEPEIWDGGAEDDDGGPDA